MRFFAAAGQGLLVIDGVTVRQVNLHNELLARLTEGRAALTQYDLYAAAYRPIDRQRQPHLDIWLEALVIGQALPTLPLWLPGEICLPVDLAQLTIAPVESNG